MSVFPWKEKVDKVIGEYGKSRKALLPCLEAVQEECRYIPQEAITYLRELRCSISRYLRRDNFLRHAHY
jgi:NADH:ubiquinone oxidoreductase subunit E